jgi:hypothetical protein
MELPILSNSQASLMLLTNLLMQLYISETLKHKLIYDIFNFAIVQFIDYLLCNPKHLHLVIIYLFNPFLNGPEPS